MPLTMAEHFFSNVSIGTPVTIHQTGPATETAGEDSKPQRKGLFGRS
jgi:hypothetical protein